MTTQTPSPRTPYSASFSIVAGTTDSGTISTGLKNQQGVLRSVRGSATSSTTSTALAVRVGEAAGSGLSSIDEVDAEEGTVELRSNISAATGHDLDPQQALNLIKDAVPEVFYRGSWYFTFEGGCITYNFDAEGTLAETVAEDAEGAVGFYPALELRQFAADEGFDIG